MSVKLTLDDGTEWTVGEEIEIQLLSGKWSRVVTTNTTLKFLLDKPEKFRKIPAPVEVPLTDSDVLEMLREGGIEFKRLDGIWYSGSRYTVESSGKCKIWGIDMEYYTHYRRRSENGVERKMVKLA